jgi:sulfatase maturation enzyme AslB (radical SAM superfamily)
MLSGKQNSACSQCYREESVGLTSFRENKNLDINNFNIDVDTLIKYTDADGTLHDFKMQYWDSRFSNICNYKCRMCGPPYSHTWAEEAYRGTGRKDFVIQAHDTDNWNDIIAKYGDLSKLKEVYFAGGEALYQKEHWLMLDHLDSLSLHNIRITYTTNLSKLSFGKYQLEDYLKRFTNVLFIVSLDATGPLLEYVRSGANWANTQSNIKTVLTYPNVKLKFNVVITVYNILHLSEVIDFAFDNSTVFEGTDLTVAHGPPEQNITNLPIPLKDLARDRLLASSKYEILKHKIDGVINYMYQQPVSTWQTVIETTNKLDQKRNERTLDVNPEFSAYWKY